MLDHHPQPLSLTCHACQRHSGRWTCDDPTVDQAVLRTMMGWTTDDDANDLCPACTRQRASEHALYMMGRRP